MLTTNNIHRWQESIYQSFFLHISLKQKISDNRQCRSIIANSSNITTSLDYVGDNFSWLVGLWAETWEFGELVLLRESSKLSKSSSSSSTSTSIFSSSSNDVIDLAVGDDAPRQLSLSPLCWFWSLKHKEKLRE